MHALTIEICYRSADRLVEFRRQEIKISAIRSDEQLQTNTAALAGNKTIGNVSLRNELALKGSLNIGVRLRLIRMDLYYDYSFLQSTHYWKVKIYW